MSEASEYVKLFSEELSKEIEMRRQAEASAAALQERIKELEERDKEWLEARDGWLKENDSLRQALSAPVAVDDGFGAADLPACLIIGRQREKIWRLDRLVLARMGEVEVLAKVISSLRADLESKGTGVLEAIEDRNKARAAAVEWETRANAAHKSWGEASARVDLLEVDRVALLGRIDHLEVECHKRAKHENELEADKKELLKVIEGLEGRVRDREERIRHLETTVANQGARIRGLEKDLGM